MRIMSMTVKCSDMFYCNISDGEKYVLEDYEGYVPDFMPDDHYGDYVILDIDLDTGKIVNWRPNITEQVDRFIAENNSLA
jgi:hypothetical protein